MELYGKQWETGELAPDGQYVVISCEEEVTRNASEYRPGTHRFAESGYEILTEAMQMSNGVLVRTRIRGTSVPEVQSPNFIPNVQIVRDYCGRWEFRNIE